MSSSNLLKRLNCKAVNSTISVQVLEIFDIPEVYEDLPLCIEVVRNAKNSVRSPSLIPYDWKSQTRDALSVPATMYRDTKGECLPKVVSMKLLDGRTKKSLAEFKFDAALFVTAPNASPRTIDLKAISKASRLKSSRLKLHISTIFGGDKNIQDEVSTVQSGMTPEDNDLSGFTILDENNNNVEDDEASARFDALLNGSDNVSCVTESTIEDDESQLETLQENERLRQELQQLKETAMKERAEAARKMRELENEVERLYSESMSRQSIDSTSSAQSFVSNSQRESFAQEVNSAVLELSSAADKASRLPPTALVNQWITVEGKGVGKVLAFHKEWLPGTNSLHTVEFGGPWGGWGGGRLQSVSEKVLLRRPKLSKVKNWGTGEMNGGLLFAMAHEPQALLEQDNSGSAGGGGGGGGFYTQNTQDGQNNGNWSGGEYVNNNGSGGLSGEDMKQETQHDRNSDLTNSDEARDDVGPLRILKPVASESDLSSDGSDSAASPSSAAAERFRARSLARLQSKLPEGWTASIDPDSQRPFFVNGLTGDSQWEAPTTPATN